MTIIAKQFGFSNNLGALANIVDGDLSTFWAPLATTFSQYPDQFFIGDTALHVLNVGPAFAALEFDFGAPVNINQIYVKVEDTLTLGPALLIGSDNPASSPANTLQLGDIFLGYYPQEQISSNVFLDVPVMQADATIKKRYLRLLQRSSVTAVEQPSPGPVNSFTDELDGVKHFEVPNYTTKLTIEVWGAGASGGLSAHAQNGGGSSVHVGIVADLEAGGGNKSTATTQNPTTGAGTGGTATGGNVANTPGNPGSATSVDFAGGGGGPVGVFLLGLEIIIASILGILGRTFVFGQDGVAPGGGGGGHAYLFPPHINDIPTSSARYPGGGSGGYVKHEILRGSGDADPNSIINYTVGKGGVSDDGDGKGANGRVRFSWT